MTVVQSTASPLLTAAADAFLSAWDEILAERGQRYDAMNMNETLAQRNATKLRAPLARATARNNCDALEASVSKLDGRLQELARAIVVEFRKANP